MMNDELRNHSPLDLRPLPGVAVTSTSEVAQVIDGARQAQVAWEQVPFRERARRLKAACKEMLRRRQEFMESISLEAGKPLGELLLSEVAGPLQYIKDWIAVAGPALGSKRLAIPKLAFPGKWGRTHRKPRGVVGVISPWNYPMGNFFKPVFPALLSGNAVVVKPSEYAPLTGQLFIEILQKHLPPNVLSLVQGGGEVGEALIGGVDALTFTGSYKTGRHVAEACARRLIPVSLELGGKDAALVLADCNLDRTVAGVVAWSLHNSGQACGNMERVYVEASLADHFVSRVTDVVGRVKGFEGDLSQCDVGVAVTREQFDLIQEHIADAVAKGARVLVGGKPTGHGLGLQPTVLDGCDHTMAIMREPTFGPVIPIMRVRDAEHGIQCVNDCDYGLNASVWTGDLKRGEALAGRMNVGTSFVNNHAFTGAMPSAPWTGVKHSGYGVANSAQAIAHYTRPHSVVLDKNKKADGWWLPMSSKAQELGQCLCEAQLGNIPKALKVPGLMMGREKQVLAFVRGPLEGRFNKVRGSLWGVPRWIQNALSFIIAPPLLPFEKSWADSIHRAVCANDGPVQPMSSKEYREFIESMERDIPLTVKLLLRVSTWAVTWGTLFTRGRPFFMLSGKTQEAALNSWVRSDIYVGRQIAFFLKTAAGLSHLSTSRVQGALKSQVAQSKTERSADHGPTLSR